jgi:hypothetical protein
MGIEDEFVNIVNKFLKDENKEAFFSNLKNWGNSTYNILKQQGKTDEEINKIVSDTLFLAGYKFARTIDIPSDIDEALKEVLGVGILQFLVAQKHRGVKG